MTERTLTSRLFWGMRGCTVAVQLILIYGVERMVTEAESMQYILGVPAEFVPTVMVIALVVGLICTFAMSLPGYYAQDKKVARENGGKLTYGLSYLSSNILIVVICVVLSLIIIGWYLDASGAVASGGLCYAIALVVSVFVGLGGSKYITLPFVEALRDKAKAADARSKTE